MVRRSKTSASKAGSHDAGSAVRFSKQGPLDLEELAQQQGVKPVGNPEELQGDFWPEEETLDDFLAALRSWRCEGREEC